MAEFISKSGAKIIINPASFETAQNLWSAVEKIASQENIKVGGGMINLVMAIDSFPEFKQALWPCLIRCTRNDIKIEKSTFEDVEVRKEYYEIIAPCVEINISPFVESLISEFDKRLGQLVKDKTEKESLK